MINGYQNTVKEVKRNNFDKNLVNKAKKIMIWILIVINEINTLWNDQ